MTGSEYQNYIMDNFVNPSIAETFNNASGIERYDEKYAMLNVSLGLTGESGEFADIVKKVLFHGHPLTEELKDKLKKELGDIRFYQVWGCRLLDMTPEECDRMNVDKLDARYQNGFNTNDSIQRRDTK